MSGQLHALTSLPPKKKPLYGRVLEPWNHSGTLEKTLGLLPLPGIEPRFLDDPAHIGTYLD